LHPIAVYAARIAVALFPRSSDVLSLLLEHLRTNDPRMLKTGIEGLTRMLSANPELLPELCDWAVNDAEGRVRQAALEVVTAVQAGDPDVLTLLHERAVHDPERRVRQAAMRALTAVRADDPDVLTLLRERAAHDPHSDVRQAAVQTLCNPYRRQRCLRATASAGGQGSDRPRPAGRGGGPLAAG
jgi:HEAT repeat protein